MYTGNTCIICISTSGIVAEVLDLWGEQKQWKARVVGKPCICISTRWGMPDTAQCVQLAVAASAEVLNLQGELMHASMEQVCMHVAFMADVDQGLHQRAHTVASKSSICGASGGVQA